MNDRQTPPCEMSLEELGKTVDKNCQRIGLTVAEIFRTLSFAAPALPDMDLRTESMDLKVDDDGISVTIRMPKESDLENDGSDDTGNSRNQCDWDFRSVHTADNDEEGMIYDEF